MNKQRRRALSNIYSQIENVIAQLEEVKDEEQDAFDNMPPNLQESDRGEAMQEAIYAMEGAFNALEEANCELDNLELE